MSEKKSGKSPKNRTLNPTLSPTLILNDPQVSIPNNSRIMSGSTTVHSSQIEKPVVRCTNPQKIQSMQNETFSSILMKTRSNLEGKESKFKFRTPVKPQDKKIIDQCIISSGKRKRSKQVRNETLKKTKVGGSDYFQKQPDIKTSLGKLIAKFEEREKPF